MVTDIHNQHTDVTTKNNCYSSNHQKHLRIHYTVVFTGDRIYTTTYINGDGIGAWNGKFILYSCYILKCYSTIYTTNSICASTLISSLFFQTSKWTLHPMIYILSSI